MPNKALAAGSGSGVGGAVATLIIALFWHTASPEVAAALTTLMTAASGALAAYLTPHEGA